MKRIDLHTHAKVSKMFPFEMRSVHQIIAQARRVGLDGVALVEHFHAENFWGVHDEISRVFAYADGVYRIDDEFRILTGAELSLRDDGRAADLVILGSLEQLRQVNRGLASPATRAYRPSFAEAIAVARQAGVFVIGAHMYRPGKELAAFGGDRLGALDALEANGKDFHTDERVHAAAGRLGVPVVGGSDAHFWPQVGIKATVLPIGEITQASVMGAIRDGTASVESLTYGPLAVQISGAYKRILKARRARHEVGAGAHGEARRHTPRLGEVAGRAR